jgi:hypothetical protein
MENHGHYRLEPEILDQDMNRSDLVFALQHLQYGKTGLAPVKLDADRGPADSSPGRAQPAPGGTPTDERCLLVHVR